MKKTAHAFNEENIKYLRGIFGDEKVDTFILVLDSKSDRVISSEDDQKSFDTVKKYLEQMEKFGDNHWWLSEDKRVLGYYQLMNPILLVSFDKFHEALEFLLGRPVWTHEMGLNYEGLKAEAERAFKGTQDSEEQKAESIKKSFEQLADLGKTVIGVVVD